MIRSQAVRALAGAAAHTLSQPVTASLVAYRNSHPCLAGGGAARSRRFGIASARRWSNRVAAGFNRSAQPTGEPRVGVHLGGGPPLTNELAEGAVVVELGCSCDHPGELVSKLATVRRRKELEPPEGVAESMAEGARAVYCEVAKRSRHRAKRVGSFNLPIGATQPQVGLVAPTQKNVAVLDLARDVLWMTKEVREWSLDHTHADRISEVLQKLSALVLIREGYRQPRRPSFDRV